MRIVFSSSNVILNPYHATKYTHTLRNGKSTIDHVFKHIISRLPSLRTRLASSTVSCVWAFNYVLLNKTHFLIAPHLKKVQKTTCPTKSPNKLNYYGRSGLRYSCRRNTYLNYPGFVEGF